MLSVLVTDFLQFIVMSAGLLIVTVLVFVNVGWTTMIEAVREHHGEGGINPFVHPDMGWPYLIFNTLLNLAATLTWQTTIQRVLAAKDTATGCKVYTRTAFFFVCRFMIPAMWGIAALATLTPEQYAGNSLHAMPVFLSTFLPVGIMGILVAAMLAADMSTDSSYMITWGGIIYNDILAPFRKRIHSEQQGILWNRCIIALIGVFLMFWGLWYQLEGDLWTYLGVTGTIYLSSMAALLIACCYWKRANDWGAFGAIIVGAAVPLGFLVLEIVPQTRDLAKQIGPYYSGIAAYVCAGMAMVIGSLLKPMGVKGLVWLGGVLVVAIAGIIGVCALGLQGFWLGVAAACVVWYSTVTVIVAVRGAEDIKGMLRRLGGSKE
jgi:SSS family solute:Na+ symporter